jgi:hypothetical protein
MSTALAKDSGFRKMVRAFLEAEPFLAAFRAAFFFGAAFFEPFDFALDFEAFFAMALLSL